MRVNTLFESYLEDGCNCTKKDREVEKLSKKLDGKEHITAEDLADYEYLARQAGFYAGFKMAKEILA